MKLRERETRLVQRAQETITKLNLKDFLNPILINLVKQAEKDLKKIP